MSLRDFKQKLLQVCAPAESGTQFNDEAQQRLTKSCPTDRTLSVPDPYPASPVLSSTLDKPSVRPHKRIRLSDYASLLSLPHGPTLVESSRHRLEQEEQRVDHGLRIPQEPRSIEEDRYFSTGEGTYELQNQTEVDISGDSEAGLSIRSESDGLQEPLVLSTTISEDVGIVQVPSSINSRLLEHQREGVKFLYSLYRENKGGVLGDDMGLGKTIQVIAFLAAVLKSDGQQTVKNGNNYCKVYRKQVLIICPTSVLRNWEQEMHAWSTFDVAIYHGIHRQNVFSRLESGSLQIVLTSFDTFRIHGGCLVSMDWDCAIVDEAHRLKNEKSDLYKACIQLRTEKRYGLTGTIMQNKMMDLFNVFDWAIPGCLGAREHFKEFYDEPLKQGQRISAPERFVKIANERRLHLAKVIKKYLLRREKHDTIGHLMMGKEDNVIFCEMSTLQRKVYKRLLASPDFQCLIRKDDLCSCGGPLTYAECCHRTVPNGIIWSYLHKENADGCDSCPYCMILPCLVKLQQVSNHLELIKPNPKDEVEKQKKDEMLAELVLGEDADLVGGIFQHESFLDLSDSQHCGKMRALEILLAQWLKEGDKVLLFSYSVRMLDILDKFLIRKGYCFSRLDGSTAMSMRQTLVDEFNRSPSKQVFLISTRAGGLGLNLVSANRVVIFDPNWNPAQDLQAQDRSFRFGQKRHVTVYRLLAAGSLEELVYTRQIYKQQLFNIAVSGNLEKRYFEGVQDSKDYKGELFGISNLFRDLSEEAFTSEIIEKHDNRKLRYMVNDSRINVTSRSSMNGGKNISKLNRTDKQKVLHDNIDSVLRNAGVVYAHRNEDVVNSRSNSRIGDGPSSLRKQSSECCRAVLDVPQVACGNLEDLFVEENPAVDKAQAPRTCEGKFVSKEEQFASLASFKGMDQTQFSKWLLTVSGEEKEALLRNFKQRKKVI